MISFRKTSHLPWPTWYGISSQAKFLRPRVVAGRGMKILWWSATSVARLDQCQYKYMQTNAIITHVRTDSFCLLSRYVSLMTLASPKCHELFLYPLTRKFNNSRPLSHYVSIPSLYLARVCYLDHLLDITI